MSSFLSHEVSKWFPRKQPSTIVVTTVVVVVVVVVAIVAVIPVDVSDANEVEQNLNFWLEHHETKSHGGKKNCPLQNFLAKKNVLHRNSRNSRSSVSDRLGFGFGVSGSFSVFTSDQNFYRNLNFRSEPREIFFLENDEKIGSADWKSRFSCRCDFRSNYV